MLNLADQYFCKIDNLPPLPERFINEGLASNFVYNPMPALWWAPCSFEETEFYKKLEEKFGFTRVNFNMFPANSIYDWHTDSTRRCSINWVLKTNPMAHTFYKEPIKETVIIEGQQTLVNHLLEVDYDLYKPVLLNTTKKHCVVNNYNDTRIIMSVSVFNNFSYEDVLTYLKSLTVTTY